MVRTFGMIVGQIIKVKEERLLDRLAWTLGSKVLQGFKKIFVCISRPVNKIESSQVSLHYKHAD